MARSSLIRRKPPPMTADSGRRKPRDSPSGAARALVPSEKELALLLRRAKGKGKEPNITEFYRSLVADVTQRLSQRKKRKKPRDIVPTREVTRYHDLVDLSLSGQMTPLERDELSALERKFDSQEGDITPFDRMVKMALAEIDGMVSSHGRKSQ